MEKFNRTQKQIVNAVKEISKVKPLSKVTVNDIVEFCEMNRSTFYYHFKDIRDLVNCVFHVEVSVEAQNFFISKDISLVEATRFVMERLYAEKEFYCGAVSLDGQNGFPEFMYSETKKNCEFLTKVLFANQNLDTSNISTVTSTTIEAIHHYVLMAHYYSMLEWIRGGMKKTPAQLSAEVDFSGNVLYEKLCEMIINDNK